MISTSQATLTHLMTTKRVAAMAAAAGTRDATCLRPWYVFFISFLIYTLLLIIHGQTMGMNGNNERTREWGTRQGRETTGAQAWDADASQASGAFFFLFFSYITNVYLTVDMHMATTITTNGIPIHDNGHDDGYGQPPLPPPPYSKSQQWQQQQQHNDDHGWPPPYDDALPQ